MSTKPVVEDLRPPVTTGDPIVEPVFEAEALAETEEGEELLSLDEEDKLMVTLAKTQGPLSQESLIAAVNDLDDPVDQNAIQAEVKAMVDVTSPYRDEARSHVMTVGDMLHSLSQEKERDPPAFNPVPNQVPSDPGTPKKASASEFLVSEHQSVAGDHLSELHSATDKLERAVQVSRNEQDILRNSLGDLQKRVEFIEPLTTVIEELRRANDGYRAEVSELMVEIVSLKALINDLRINHSFRDESRSKGGGEIKDLVPDDIGGNFGDRARAYQESASRADSAPPAVTKEPRPHALAIRASDLRRDEDDDNDLDP